MTNDTRTSDDIERDIEQERARMSSTINDLQKKFSVETIVGDVGTMLRNQGGDIGRAVSATVGRNPAAAALIGVGLAWLLIGQTRNGSSDPGDRRDSARSTHDTWDRSGDPTGAAGPGWSDDVTGARDDFWYGNDEMARFRRARGLSLEGAGSDEAQKWAQRNRIGVQDTGSSGETPAGAARGVVGALSGAANSVGAAVSGVAATVGDAVSGAASSVSDAAARMTARLSHGLEGLSDDARDRVMTARRAAHDAREASRQTARKGARVAVNLFEDQPLVVGALAVAVGAAMGGVLPRSKVEDAALGASSDQLFARAQALYRDERDKAMAALRMAASDVTDEIRSAGTDLADMLPDGKTVAEVIVDRAAGVASRVYDRAAGDVQHDGWKQPQG